MKKFFKTVFIVGLCGIGVIAAAHAVLGKQRARDAAKALQQMAQGEVDELIARQQDMEKELAKLRAEYPKQIATIRSQIREVERRQEEVGKEETRATDIVRLCEEDISYLENQRDIVGSVYAKDRVIEHRGSQYNSAEAETLIGRIAETRGLYSDRLADMKTEREVLAAEKEQLELELAELRSEQAEFEVEYQSLLREIERLKRNEDLLKIKEGRNSCGKDKHGEAMSTLTEVKSAIERARFEQEERMKAARIAPKSLDYETRARLIEVQRQREAKQKTQATPESAAPEKETANEAEDKEEELQVDFRNN
ncbi:MAG: hypothetical protein IPK87_11100 [Planctomycetes bacterium]|nr:hypothetical protein [Planctomycetota bacterium]